jgi:O-6-methylguanine DNA methyltransferase
MRCQQVQTLLEELTLPRLQAGKHTALHRHVQRCTHCQRLWNQWQHYEQQLIDLSLAEPAPPGLWESIMTKVEAHETTDTGEIIWQAVSFEVSPQGLRRLVLPSPVRQEMTGGNTARPETASPLVARAYTQLAEYFRGERAIFQLPVDLRQCSDFERTVLKATTTIPYGEVRSYKWLAEQIGHPRASRAVGNALHKNPVPIVIPCHRVVKSDGSIGGYAFGEVWKTRLLALERDTVPFVGCSSTRTLCYRGCRHERRVREINRIHFAHFHEALESGYRPCAVCQPGKGSHR